MLRSIAATHSRYDWPRNLRELKTYAERLLLMDGRVGATPEESAPRARTRILGCTEVVSLERWLGLAATSASLEAFTAALE